MFHRLSILILDHINIQAIQLPNTFRLTSHIKTISSKFHTLQPVLYKTVCTVS